MDEEEDYSDSDWSDSYDDQGSSYWESYLGGPDDEYFEPSSDSEEDYGSDWNDSDPGEEFFEPDETNESMTITSHDRKSLRALAESMAAHADRLQVQGIAIIDEAAMIRARSRLLIESIDSDSPSSDPAIDSQPNEQNGTDTAFEDDIPF